MDKNRQSAHRARFFHREGVFTAVRRFEYGQRVFEQGEVFPWRELGMHIHQVHALWLSVLIDSELAPPTPVPREPARKGKKPATSAEV